MTTRSPHSILIVDDDANLRIALSDFLKFEGFTVTTASSGEDALEKLEDLSPNLIILDMSMPGMGGLEFLKQISSDGGRAPYPVLVLTARANMRELFEDVWVDGFMSKPCEPQSLIAEIRAILSDAERKPNVAQGEQVSGCILVCLDTDATAGHVRTRLESEGLVVISSEPGLALVGDSVRKNPDCIVLGPHAHGMSITALATILAQMPQTTGIPIVAAGLEQESDDQGQVWPEDRQLDHQLDTLDPDMIVRSVLSVLEIPGDSQ